jgi:hypothetical protein
MNTPIRSTRLFCVGLLGLALCACTTTIDVSGMRPEIARPLSQAENFWQLGDPSAARDSVKAAEAVPNQTADEKQKVASVEALVTHNDNYQNSNFPPRGPIQDSLAEQEIVC